LGVLTIPQLGVTIIPPMSKLRVFTILVIGLLLILASCGAPAPPPSTIPFSPMPAPTSTTNVEHKEPALSTTLKKDCLINQSSVRGFDNAGLEIGEQAVNFTLRDIHGSEFRLSRLLVDKPVMMVFGSFT